MLCSEEKGIWRANKIIAQCLQTLLWKNRIEISKYIINDRVNYENANEFIHEFENYTKKSDKFCYDDLEYESKMIYDMLLKKKCN